MSELGASFGTQQAHILTLSFLRKCSCLGESRAAHISGSPSKRTTPFPVDKRRVTRIQGLSKVDISIIGYVLQLWWLKTPMIEAFPPKALLDWKNFKHIHELHYINNYWHLLHVILFLSNCTFGPFQQKTGLGFSSPLSINGFSQFSSPWRLHRFAAGTIRCPCHQQPRFGDPTVNLPRKDVANHQDTLFLAQEVTTWKKCNGFVWEK